MDDDKGIKNYFAAFHLHDTFPAAVVVDDFRDSFEERYLVSNVIFSCKKYAQYIQKIILFFTILPMC